MITELQREQLKQVLRPTQIIVAALASGIVAFFIIVLVLGPKVAGEAQPAGRLVTNAGFAFAIVGAVAWIVLRNVLARQSRKSVLAGDARRLAADYQTRLIVSCALLEGIAMLNLVAYLIEGQQASLIYAGAYLLILVCQFPTLDRLERLVESELAAVEQLRQLEPPRGR